MTRYSQVDHDTPPNLNSTSLGSQEDGKSANYTYKQIFDLFVAEGISNGSVQNNLFVPITVDTTASVEDDISTRLNQSVQFEIAGDQLAIIEDTIPDPVGDFEEHGRTITRRYFLKPGKGVYGLDSENEVSSGQLYFIDEKLSASREDNPDNVTKAQVGLSNVDNTADSEKEVSQPQMIALSQKMEKGTYGGSAQDLYDFINLANSQTGSRRYGLLSEVNALTDRLTTEEYRVTNDGVGEGDDINVDNNGVYTWDGVSDNVSYNRPLGVKNSVIPTLDPENRLKGISSLYTSFNGVDGKIEFNEALLFNSNGHYFKFKVTARELGKIIFSSSTDGCFISFTSSGIGQLAIRKSDSTILTTQGFATSTFPILDEENEISLVWEDDLVKIYRNGSFQKSFPQFSFIIDTVASGFNGFFDGAIRDLSYKSFSQEKENITPYLEAYKNQASLSGGVEIYVSNDGYLTKEQVIKFKEIDKINTIEMLNNIPLYSSKGLYEYKPDNPVKGLISLFLTGNGLNDEDQYYIKYILLNSASGFDYFTISRVGENDTFGVCSLFTNATERSGKEIIHLPFRNFYDIEGYAYVDWDNYETVSNGDPDLYKLTRSTFNERLSLEVPTVENTRLLYSNKLFAFEPMNVPFFKESLLTSNIEGSKIIAFSENDNTDSLLEFTSNDYFKIDYNDLGSSLKLVHNVDSIVTKNRLFGRDLEVSKATSADVVGKDDYCFVIGDSITDWRLLQYIGRINTSHNATLQFSGLINGPDDGGFPNEGRASWSYAILVGARTDASGSAVFPQSIGDNLGSRFKNPFIRVATASDISNFPERCYENTPATDGVIKGVYARELNYTESQAVGTYTGNYYIFDFAHYMINFVGPLTVGKKVLFLNQLGFNDIDYPAIISDSITYDAYSDEVIDYTVIHLMQFLEGAVSYFDAQSIDYKIGLTGLLSLSLDRNWSQASKWIERVISIAEAQENSGNSVEFVPVLPHIDRRTSWNYTSITNISELDPNTASLNKMFKTTDDRHPSAFASTFIGNALIRWIANKIK